VVDSLPRYLANVVPGWRLYFSFVISFDYSKMSLFGTGGAISSDQFGSFNLQKSIKCNIIVATGRIEQVARTHDTENKALYRCDG